MRGSREIHIQPTVKRPDGEQDGAMRNSRLAELDASTGLRDVQEVPSLVGACRGADPLMLRLTCDTPEELAELVSLLDPFQNP